MQYSTKELDRFRSSLVKPGRKSGSEVVCSSSCSFSPGEVKMPDKLRMKAGSVQVAHGYRRWGTRSRPLLCSADSGKLLASFQLPFHVAHISSSSSSEPTLVPNLALNTRRSQHNLICRTSHLVLGFGTLQTLAPGAAAPRYSLRTADEPETRNRRKETASPIAKWTTKH
jgi:hypothetical protein